MKRIVVIAAIVCLAMIPVLAKADTLTFNGASNNGIGPYSLTDGSEALSLFGMNDQNGEKHGESWTVNVVNGSAFAGSAEFTTGFEYEEEAYIAGQYDGTNASTVQYALWQVFDPFNFGNYNTGSDALVWDAYNFASANVGNTAGNAVLSDATFYIWDGGNVTHQDRNLAPQDFVGSSAGNNSPVPEPSSLLLFGSGLVGLAGLLRRSMLSE